MLYELYRSYTGFLDATVYTVNSVVSQKFIMRDDKKYYSLNSNKANVREQNWKYLGREILIWLRFVNSFNFVSRNSLVKGIINFRYTF